MSVRRRTENRLTLYRTCHTCGKSIVTTASSPFIRQLYNVDGKKQKTCYFCSEKCKNVTYKHKGWYDGKAEIRRDIREANRDVKAKNKKYYEAHKEQERERARRRYWADPEAARESNRYSKQKRKLMEVQN